MEDKVELPVSGRALGQDRDREPTMYGGLEEQTGERENNGMAKNVHRSLRARKNQERGKGRKPPTRKTQGPVYRATM